MNQIIAYSNACRAVAAAKTFDAIQDIASRAEAMRAYAVQAKNRQLEIDAAEIRIRAQRRLGELLLALKGAGGLTSGGRPPATDLRPRLDDLGIDRKLSARAQVLARQPVEAFEISVDRWRSDLAFSRKRAPTTLQPHVAPKDRARTLLDGTQIAKIKKGSLRQMISERAAELSLLRRISDHCQAADNLAVIGDLIGPYDLDGMISEMVVTQ